MKLLNKLTGKLEEVPDDQADAAVLGSGGTLDYPDAAELERGGRLEQFGSGGQQALGAVESVARTATFGLVPGFGSDAEIAGRERTLREESPGIAFGSQAVGSFIPGMGAAGLATRGLKLAGAGARATGVGAVLAEGATTGLAEEVEQSRYEGRGISAGNVLLYGVGGELAGRALPAVLRRGAAKVKGDALAAITGDGAQNVATMAEKRSLRRAARDAPKMPKGPERDAVLARTADEQYDRASREMRQSLDDGMRRFAATEDVPARTLKGLVAKDSPVQMRWGTETAEQIGELSKGATGKTRKALDDVSKQLLEAEKGHAIFTTARDARKALGDLPAGPERDAALQALRQGTSRVDLWGRAAELDGELARTADMFADAAPAIRRELGQGDAIDPAKIRAMLKKDKLGRTVSEERLTRLAQALEDRAAVHAKWGTGGSSVVDQLKKDAARLRGATAIADDVQAAVMSAPKPNGGKAPKSGGMGGEVLETVADMALGSMGLPPVAGMIRKSGAAVDRIKAIMARRKGQTGAVEIGGQSLLQKRLDGHGKLKTDVARIRSEMQAADIEVSKHGIARVEATTPEASKAAAKLEKQAKAKFEKLESKLDGLENAPPDSTDLDEALNSLAYDLDQAGDLKGLELKEALAKAQTSDDLEAIARRFVGSAGERGFAEVGQGVGSILASPMGVTAGVGIAAAGALAAFQNLDANARAAIKETARRIIKPSGEPKELSESTALSRFAGDYPGPRESYEAKREMLTAISRDPGVLAQAISESFGDLPSADPRLASKLAGRIMTQFSYVTENMPASIATSLLYPRGVPPSESSLRDFAMLWSAVMDPETVLDDLEEGLATPAQIQALREVHPDIYGDLLQNVIDQVSTNFGEIDGNTKVWLDILFDADGLAGPSFSWRAADMIGRSYEESKLRGGQNAQTLDASLNEVATPTAGLNALATSVTNKGA